MSVHSQAFRQDAVGIVPSLLLWMAFILAALGIVAHVAFI